MKMKVIAAGLCVASLLAGEGRAEPEVTMGTNGQNCMSADLGIVPARVTFDDGSVVSLLGQSGKVLVRRLEQPKVRPYEMRSKFGFYPLEISMSHGRTTYDWETDLVALVAIEASGATFRADGTMTEPGKEPTQIAMEISVDGRETVEFGGCAYEVLRVTVAHFRNGKQTHVALVSYHPDLWMSFRTERRPADGSAPVITQPLDISTIR